MIQNYLPLIHALIDAFIFLETSGDNEVDPDSAVECMENMAASLLELTRKDQIELRFHMAKIADDAEDLKYAKFVRELPNAIGLAKGRKPR